MERPDDDIYHSNNNCAAEHLPEFGDPDFPKLDDNSIEPIEDIEEIIQAKTNKNVRDLNNFIRSNNFITEKGDQTTNIINVSERKTYYIPDAHIEEFFARAESCRKTNCMLHFSERQETDTKSKSGIMIDFDRYQLSRDAQINDRHFDSLTRHISKLIAEFVDFSDAITDGKLTYYMFYIRKPAVVLDAAKSAAGPPQYKDGFHILIPEIQVTKGLKRYIIQELNARNIIKNTFKDIPHNGPPEDMLDKASANNPVHFFGHSKPGKPSYPLTHVYEIGMYDDGDIDRIPIPVTDINNGKFNSRDINLTYELSLGFYMEYFNGVQTWLKKRQLNYKTELETKIQIIVEKTSKEILSEDELFAADNSVDVLTMSDANAGYIKKLLEILDISFATEYEKWFKVMCAIAHTSTRYKDIAWWFSQRRPESWSPTEFERVWNEAIAGKYSNNPVTKRSIMHWAKESSPERYKKINTENYNYKLIKMTYDNEGRVEHAMAARVLHAMLGDKFVVDVGFNDQTGKSGYCWYEFVLPGQAMKKGEVFKWRKELEPDNIHLFISEHLPKVYTEVAQTIKDRKDSADNEALTKYWANVERTFKMYLSRLYNNGFQNGIIQQSQYMFRSRGFFDELDSYEDIIGIGNGVLKIGADPQLIKGFHEYKISKFTETDYKPFDPEDPYTKVLLKAFRDIFPEEDVFNFMLYHASTGLDARESACLLMLLVGGGQNGKTFFAKMVHNTLGNQYCAVGKSGLLTAPIEQSEKPNSAQMQSKDKRWMYFDEFNKCESLNIARVKGFINPGWQSGRDLNSRQSNFKNTCNPIALSNYDFTINTVDHGTWRRIYYYRNKVKFCSNPTPGNPYEKKEDRRFINEYANDPLYRQAMLSIMVHYYSKLCRLYDGDIKNVPVPTIMAETEEFRNRQDTLNRFITQMIVKSPDSPDVGLPTLSTKYIDWYIRNINKTSALTALDVQTQFENSRIHPFLELRNGVKWLKGHRLKDYIEDDLREGEIELTVPKSAPKLVESYVEPEIKTQRVKDSDDAFIRSLVNNAPNHIQVTAPADNVDEANNALEELLKLIV
jgi:phage/plasmid-associated DNA primase